MLTSLQQRKKSSLIGFNSTFSGLLFFFLWKSLNGSEYEGDNMKLLAFITIVLIISLVSPVHSIEISGRILIDTGHSSHDIQSILSSAITVLEINNYLVKMSNSLGILDDFDVLILSVPTQPYSVQELNSIHRFIENGGGLFLMGESGILDSADIRDLNTLAKNYGIEFQRDIIVDEKEHITLDEPYPEIPIIQNFAVHPVTHNVKKIFFSSGCSLRLSKSAKALAWGNEETYGDRLSEIYGFRGGTYEPYLEKKGDELIVLASAESNQGRIIAIGDTSLFRGQKAALRSWPTDPIDYFNHKKLLLNIIDWLSQKIKKENTSTIIHEEINTARYLISQGNYEEAAHVLSMAKSLTYLTENSVLSKEIARLSYEASRGSEADRLFREGQSYVLHLDCDKALSSLRDALTIYRNLGNVTKTQECLTLLNQCGIITTKIQKAEVLFELGVRYAQLKKYDEAVKKLQEASLIYETIDQIDKVNECKRRIEDIIFKQKSEEKERILRRNKLILTIILLAFLFSFASLYFKKRIYRLK
jgi:tetratricopeptide (TPR) repeat protein